MICWQKLRIGFISLFQKYYAQQYSKFGSYTAALASDGLLRFMTQGYLTDSWGLFNYYNGVQVQSLNLFMEAIHIANGNQDVVIQNQLTLFNANIAAQRKLMPTNTLLTQYVPALWSSHMVWDRTLNILWNNVYTTNTEDPISSTSNLLFFASTTSRSIFRETFCLGIDCQA